jgi:hypothetical protein
LFENVLNPDAMIDVAATVPVNVALPDVSNVRELLDMTSFVVVLYVRQLTASFVAARIGFTKNALAVAGAKFDPDAFRMIELAPWLEYPAPRPRATADVP